MNNKYLKKANTVIELTSLMDVIFILLAVIICRQQINMTEKEKYAEASVIEAEAAVKKADELKDTAEAAVTEKEMLREQLELCSDVFSQVTLVAVSLNYEQSIPEHRIIRVAVNDNEPVKMTMLTPKEPGKGFDELTEYLAGIMEEADGRPVILSVDRSKILYRDDRELTVILNQFYNGYSNLYQRVRSDE